MTEIERRLTAIEDALQRAGISLVAPAAAEPEVQIVPLEGLPVAEAVGNGTLFTDLGSHTQLSHTWLCQTPECLRENFSDGIVIASSTRDGVNVRLKCRGCGAEYASGRRFRDPLRAAAWAKSQDTGKLFDQCYQEERVAGMLFNRRQAG